MTHCRNHRNIERDCRGAVVQSQDESTTAHRRTSAIQLAGNRSHASTTVSPHTYADRARYFRAQAADAYTRGATAQARRLDSLAHRCEVAHRAQPATLDTIVELAAHIEHRQGRPLTIAESSAIKSAYHAALAGTATVGALIAELAAQGWPVDATDTGGRPPQRQAVA